MLKEAKEYISEGISVIPVVGKVCALPKWQQYQSKLMDIKDVDVLFATSVGIATIGGAVSGGLEIIDIDTKYDTTNRLWDEYSDAIKTHDPELWDKLVVIGTPSGGYHLSYRSVGECSKSGKLANRYATQEELDKHPEQKVKVLIEIKAEGGYCVAPPSIGYRLISKSKYPSVITAEQKDLLLTLAKSFNQVHEIKVDAPKRIKNYDQGNFIQSPFEHYNKEGDVVEELKKHKWEVVGTQGSRIHLKRPGDSQSKSSGNWHSDYGRFICFSTSTIFDEGKAYSAAGVFCKLNCGDDWAKCAKMLIELGFGQERKLIDSRYVKKIVSLQRSDASEEKIIKDLCKIDNMTADQAKQVLIDYKANQGKMVMQFWTITPPSDRSVDGKPKINIHLNKFIDFISGQLDVYRYMLSEGSFTYVKVADGIIEEVKITDIKDWIKAYIEKLDLVFDGIQRDDLMEVVQKQSKTLFSDEQMQFLEYTDCKVLKSDKKTAYFPFLNKIAKVTDQGVTLEDYSSIAGNVIWKKSIIAHKIEYLPEEDDTEFSFTKFIHAINNFEQKRIDYCTQIIGYLLHDYKNPANARSVIFGEESATVKGGGGTGKGLLTSAIGKLVKTVTVDGKSFDPNKGFAFQRVSLGDKIIILQDTAKNFVFENFFSKITEGLTVEKKNQNEMYIPYQDSPKFLITTNYTINNESQAARRRQYLLEFSSFYSDKNTPLDHLKEFMFDEWNVKQWNVFYSIMLNFCYFYLRDDVQPIGESNTSIEKRIAIRFGDEFLEWFDGYDASTFRLFSDIYQDFKNETDFTEKEYSRKRLTAAITFACEMKGLKKLSEKENITNKIMYKWE